MLSLVVILLSSYICGSLAFSLWAGLLLRGVDLRTVGSGNLGATNVLRTLGWKAAVPVLLLDMAKGMVPVALLAKLRVDGTPLPFGLTPFWVSLLAGVAAIAGHMWTPFARFRGGKGVATATGVFAAVAPLPTICSFLLFGVVTAMSRFVSLGSIVAALALLPLLVFLHPRHAPLAPLLIIAVPLVSLIVWKHRTNIRRLREGTESKIVIASREGARG